MKMPKDKIPRYRIETYRDKYNTLSQSIIIDLEEEKETDGRSTMFLRGRINPNLELYEEIIENKKHQVLSVEKVSDR